MKTLNIELDQEIDSLEDSIGYNIEKTKAPQAWNLSKGAGIKVAVLDTGIASHPDLSIAGGYSVVSEDYEDTHGHGTQVAGVLAASLNGEGIVGVAPEASLYAIKIMEGSSGSLSDAIAGLEWAIDNDMDIISMSFGFDSYSQIFKEVLEEAYENEGILLIAASGNEGTDNILYPAAYDSVIAVGSTDENDNLASSSSYGFDQELVAPGVNIYSTSLNNGYVSASGTSMATPLVAAVASLIWAHNHSFSNEQVRAKLRNDALDLGPLGKDDYFGYGLVQVDLETDNFTFVNSSYFYEIFNITDFRTESQAYWFWLSGNGSIDDVDFEEGVYLANITYLNGNKLSYFFSVNENGTVFPLALNGEFLDNFTQGSNSDRIVWINGNLSSRVTGSNPSSVEGVCYEKGAFGGDYDWCFFNSTSLRNACDATETSITCGAGTQCFTNAKYTPGNGSSYHTYIDASIVESDIIHARYWINCSSTASEGPSGSPFTFYTIDTKRARCLDAYNYDIEGRYGTNLWVKIGNTASCFGNGYCLYNGTNTTNPSETLNPCFDVTVCYGNFSLAIENSKGNVSNYPIKLNGVSNGTTNAAGLHTIPFTSVTCAADQTIAAYCNNNASKPCESFVESIDFDGDVDNVVFNCNICNNEKNLEVDLADIDYYQLSGSNYLFNITVHNENVNGNINITIKGQDKTAGLFSKESHKVQTLSNSSQVTYYFNLSLDTTNIDYIHAYVDFNNQIPEASETDNYVVIPFIQIKPKAYLDIATGNTYADQAIRSYLRLFVQQVPESQAEFVIAVGQNTTKVGSLNGYTKDSLKWHYDKTNNVPMFNEKPVGFTPYSGLVGRFFTAGKSHVFAYGRDIDGTVAAVKKLVSAKNLMLTQNVTTPSLLINPAVVAKYTLVVDDRDLIGLSVMDLMHNNETQPYYNQNSEAFKDVVEDILLDNNYEIAIKTVQTTNDNTTLRLKNVNSDYSVNFKDAIVNNTRPVVLSRGIHSDLLTWEDFAIDLATDPEKARDSWLIEMVGGPTIDGDCKPSGTYNCPNYTFSDLKTYYWPALIAGVERYSGQNQVDYVGFSLGCSAALESLKLYGRSGKNNAGYYFDSSTGQYVLTNLASNPVDTFVGVACPGNFTKLSSFMELFNYTSNKVFDPLKNANNTHITAATVRINIIASKDFVRQTNPSLHEKIPWTPLFFSTFVGSPKMSLNIYDEFKIWINNQSSPNLGQNVSINNLMVIQGDSNAKFSSTDNTDGIVPIEDEKQLCKNINSSNKYYLNFPDNLHAGFNSLPENRKLQLGIKEFLNNKKLLSQDLIQQYLVSNGISCEPG